MPQTFHRLPHRARRVPEDRRAGRRSLGLAALATVTGLLLAGCGFGDSARKTATEEAVVTEPVTAVEILGNRGGAIEITPGTGPGVTIHRTLHYGGPTKPTPTHELSAGVLTFHSGCGHNCFVDYALTVPAAAHARLGTSSGPVTVRGLAGADIGTGSGEVTAAALTGPLAVRTHSGRITGTELSGTTATVSASSGPVHLSFARRPASVTARTTSGDVELTVPYGTYHVETGTSSGSSEVGVRKEESADARLSVRTSSGNVRIDAS
ncbi:DUF4097 family beta strand repeat-containing protein [Streptomyces sp. NPDC051162]|uniref:DUF4097 family beta strand repeat-containing protein n=1 Tax=unclassified Streptomyces TaxID=2593676 RepID=UPI00341F7375